MFAKNKVSQSMLDAVNSVLEEGKIDEASLKIPTATGTKVLGGSGYGSKKAHLDQHKHPFEKGPSETEIEKTGKDSDLEYNRISKGVSNSYKKHAGRYFSNMDVNKPSKGREEPRYKLESVEDKEENEKHEDEKEDKKLIKKMVDKSCLKKESAFTSKLLSVFRENKASGAQETFTDNNMGENKALVGKQKKLDKNHNGKLDAQDFKMLRKEDISEEQLDEMINEVLSKDASAGDWIHDFVHSKNPKFAGKSKAERKKMALGAYYGAQKEEVEELDEAPREIAQLNKKIQAWKKAKDDIKWAHSGSDFLKSRDSVPAKSKGTAKTNRALKSHIKNWGIGTHGKSNLPEEVEQINEISKSEVEHHFNNWINSEHAPDHNDAGDDNKIHQSALGYLKHTKEPKEKHEKIAMHIADKFHGSGIWEEVELTEDYDSKLNGIANKHGFKKKDSLIGVHLEHPKHGRISLTHVGAWNHDKPIGDGQYKGSGMATHKTIHSGRGLNDLDKHLSSLSEEVELEEGDAQYKKNLGGLKAGGDAIDRGKTVKDLMKGRKYFGSGKVTLPPNSKVKELDEIEEAVQTTQDKNAGKITTDTLVGRVAGGKLNSFRNFKTNLTTSGEDSIPSEIEHGEDTKEKEKVSTNPGPVDIKLDDKLTGPTPYTHFQKKEKVTSEEFRGEAKKLQHIRDTEQEHEIKKFKTKVVQAKEEVEPINEDGWLDKYLLSKGINPRFISMATKVSHAKSTDFANWKQSHQNESTEMPFDKPYTKVSSSIKDKSGAVHTPMSRAKDLARDSLKRIKKDMGHKK